MKLATWSMAKMWDNKTNMKKEKKKIIISTILLKKKKACNLTKEKVEILEMDYI